MSIYNCHKQEPQPWMSYINPNMITYSGKCCPQLVTTTDRLLPFQIISNGVYVSAEISPYGEDNWTEITIPVSSVYTDGFFIHSYIGSLLESELLCGVYDFRVIAGETWWFEPIMVQDFDITVNGYSLVDELMTPFKFTQQIVDTTALIAPCDMILPFMFRTANVTSGTIVVTLVDDDGNETPLSITVQTAIIDSMTYYWHEGECLYPFLTCGRYYLKIVDGANTYYSVPFVPECEIEDIPDGYRVLRDMNGCVMRDIDGNIRYENCNGIYVTFEIAEDQLYSFVETFAYVVPDSSDYFVQFTITGLSTPNAGINVDIIVNGVLIVDDEYSPINNNEEFASWLTVAYTFRVGDDVRLVFNEII